MNYFDEDLLFDSDNLNNNPKFYELIGKRMQKMREDANIGQAKMGELIGLTKNHVSAIERGKNRFTLLMFFQYLSICDKSFSMVTDNAEPMGKSNDFGNITLEIDYKNQKNGFNEESKDLELARLNVIKRAMELPSDERKMVLEILSLDKKISNRFTAYLDNMSNNDNKNN